MTKTTLFLILLTAITTCAGTYHITERMVRAETLVSMNEGKKDLQQLGFIPEFIDSKQYSMVGE